MENFWTLYWVTRLDTLIQTITWVQSLSVVLLFILGGIRVSTSPHDVAEKAFTKKWMPILAVIFIASSLVRPLVPTKEDAMFIAAGVGITEAVKSETAQRIASKSVSIVEKWLDKQINEEEKEKK